jgi:antitoxin VapB
MMWLLCSAAAESEGVAMSEQTAKVFTTGRSQAVRLPKAFRFEASEVFIRRDPLTGDVILTERPSTWDGLFELYDQDDVPESFLSPEEREQPPQDRDPFADWTEEELHGEVAKP